MRWNDFLAKSLQVHPKTVPAAAASRAVAKWWLDLVRNLIVVGALQYVAFRSGNLILKGLSLGTYVFFCAYFMTQFDLWSFNPFYSVKDSRLHRALSIMSHVVVALIPLSLSIALFISVEQVAHGQGLQSLASGDVPAGYSCRRWVRSR